MKTLEVGSVAEANRQAEQVLKALYVPLHNNKHPLLSLIRQAMADEQGDLLPVEGYGELNPRAWNLLSRYINHAPDQINAVIEEVLATDPQPPLADLKGRDQVRTWLAEMLVLVLISLPTQSEPVSSGL
jgi:hypothetical protein